MRHVTLKAKASILGVSSRRVLNKRQREHKNKRQRERYREETLEQRERKNERRREQYHERYNVATHARRGNEIERARRARESSPRLSSISRGRACMQARHVLQPALIMRDHAAAPPAHQVAHETHL